MARDIYTEITAKVVQQLEAGTSQFEQPWANLMKGTLPVNAASGKAYRGINVLSLWAENRGSNVWATYQQWQGLNAQVRRGEKSATVVYWQPVERTKSRKTSEDGAAPEAKDSSYLILKYYSVFNAEQVDAIPNEDGTPGTVKVPSASLPATQAERIANAECFFAAVPATVRHGGDRACYSRSTDEVRMPGFSQFGEAKAYYSTLGHELAHWTGHERRLGREFGKRFGDEAYAMEELVAELSAAFTLGMIGLSAEPRADHAQYLASWLRVLKADAKAIFTVAGKAQAAAECLASFAGTVEEPIAA